MEYETIKNRLLTIWSLGQESESTNPEEDMMAKVILNSLSMTISDSDFQTSLTELSATYSDSVPECIDIVIPRPIAVDSDKFATFAKPQSSKESNLFLV